MSSNSRKKSRTNQNKTENRRNVSKRTRNQQTKIDKDRHKNAKTYTTKSGKTPVKEQKKRRNKRK